MLYFKRDQNKRIVSRVRILIGICTYNRPEMLVDAIDSIKAMSVKPSAIVVCDNSADKTAQDSVMGTDDVVYLHCPDQGVSNARNIVVEYALEHEYDFLAFIDDDEIVSVDWLQSYIDVLKSHQVDFACGPVFPIIDDDRSNIGWLQTTGFYSPPLRETGMLPPSSIVGCGNVIIDLKYLRAHPVRFDPKFNRSGGEDAVFFYFLQKEGARGYWVSSAIVDERLEECRYSFKYFVKRSYGLANAGTQAHSVVYGWWKSFFLVGPKAITHMFFAVGLGTIGLIRKRYLYRGIRHCCIGWGQICGLLFIRSENY